ARRSPKLSRWLNVLADGRDWRSWPGGVELRRRSSYCMSYGLREGLHGGDELVVRRRGVNATHTIKRLEVRSYDFARVAWKVIECTMDDAWNHQSACQTRTHK